MCIAMGLAAAMCILIGVFPQPLYDILPYAVDYKPYTTPHVMTQLQLLIWSALAFTFLKRTGIYPPELRSVNLDTDWVYRRFLPGFVSAVLRVGAPIQDRFFSGSKALASSLIGGVRSFHSSQGVFGRTWLTGSSVLLVAIFLAVYLLFYF
jgi:multicomponent Na+:H+ antiporter subunit D